jgi:hypothetical protein
MAPKLLIRAEGGRIHLAGPNGRPICGGGAGGASAGWNYAIGEVDCQACAAIVARQDFKAAPDLDMARPCVVDAAVGSAAIPLSAWDSVSLSAPKDLVAFAELTASELLTPQHWRDYRRFIGQVELSNDQQIRLPHPGRFEIPMLAAILVSYDLSVMVRPGGNCFSVSHAFSAQKASFFLPVDIADSLDHQLEHARAFLRGILVEATMDTVAKIQKFCAAEPAHVRESINARLTTMSARLMGRLPKL